MKPATKWIALSVLAFATIIVLCFGLTWMGIEWRGFFGPKRAIVEREIFEETPSYRHGKIQDLTRYRFQYIKATSDEARSAIASTVRLQFAQFDVSSLDQAELREFWNTCNN